MEKFLLVIRWSAIHFYPQQTLLDYCAQQKIAFVAYSPLGAAGRPEKLKRADEPSLFMIDQIQNISKETGASPAQVLLAWSMNRGAIPIPKSSHPTRQQENFNSTQIELSDEQMNRIDDLDRRFRFVDGTFWEMENGTYTVANLWDE